jgi:hypothetical protein
MSNEPPETTPHEVRANFMQRRRDKIVAEIQANRRGEYTVPTWVLTAILVAILVAFGALVYFS